jgi:hypothetical protein
VAASAPRAPFRQKQPPGSHCLTLRKKWMVQSAWVANRFPELLFTRGVLGRARLHQIFQHEASATQKNRGVQSRGFFISNNPLLEQEFALDG